METPALTMIIPPIQPGRCRLHYAVLMIQGRIDFKRDFTPTRARARRPKRQLRTWDRSSPQFELSKQPVNWIHFGGVGPGAPSVGHRVEPTRDIQKVAMMSSNECSMWENVMNLHCHSQLNWLFHSSCWRIAVKTACREQRSQLWSQEEKKKKKGNPFVLAWPRWTVRPRSGGSPLCSGERCSLRGTGKSISCLVNRWLDAPQGKQSSAVCRCCSATAFFFFFIFMYNGWRSLPGNTKHIQKGLCGFQKTVVVRFFWKVGSDTTLALKLHKRFGQ